MRFSHILLVLIAFFTLLFYHKLNPQGTMETAFVRMALGTLFGGVLAYSVLRHFREAVES